MEYSTKNADFDARREKLDVAMAAREVVRALLWAASAVVMLVATVLMPLLLPFLRAARIRRCRGTYMRCAGTPPLRGALVRLSHGETYFEIDTPAPPLREREEAAGTLAGGGGGDDDDDGDVESAGGSLGGDGDGDGDGGNGDGWLVLIAGNVGSSARSPLRPPSPSPSPEARPPGVAGSPAKSICSL